MKAALRTPLILFALFLPFALPSAHAQTLYGLRDVSGTLRVFSMNATSGATVQVADTGLSSLSFAGMAFDPIGRRYFFVSGTALVSVNVATGTVSQVPNALVMSAYDPATGLLYGLRSVSGTLRVFSMDPATGSAAQVADTGLSSFLIEDGAFDSIGRRYFFISGSGNLVSVNVTTGSVSQLPNAPGFPVFDPLTGLLYGLRTVSGTLRVFSMDPGNGATAQVADTGLSSLGLDDATFDPAGRRYFFLSGTGNLVIANVANGAVSQLPNALLGNEFDSGPQIISVPALNRLLIACLAALLALLGMRSLES